MSVTLGSQVALVGYDVKSQTPTLRADASVSNLKSQTVELTLHWQALQEMSESYTVFVHVVDASGAVRTQQDNPPMNGTYPQRSGSRASMSATSIHFLCRRPTAGDYVLEVGLYLADTGARLPIVENGDHVVLSQLHVTP